MTDKLREAAVQIVKWTARRDDLIREAHANGSSLRDIATQSGLSHAGVAKIIRRGQ